MSGEHDLSTLLRTLQPLLRSEPYVFCSVNQAAFTAYAETALGTFREDEGLTLIITQGDADRQGLQYEAIWGCITLTVHSALTAVGMIAIVSTKLAQAGISVNPVAGYYHDHLFVPWDMREHAVSLIHELSAAYAIK